MVKVKFDFSPTGIITKVMYTPQGEEYDEAIVKQIIPGVSRINLDGKVEYLYSLDFDEDNYIVGCSTNPRGNIVSTPEKMSSLIMGATKYVEGEFVLDESKAKELQDKEQEPVISEQENINIELTKELADTKVELATAQDGVVALTRMLADLKGDS